MGAPLTIEQIITNHNIGVNISDAQSLSGYTVDAFAMVGHEHSADDITMGIMDPARLPTATANAKGIVGLSSSVDSDSQTLAATPFAVRAVKNMALGKADIQHEHNPADLSAGTFDSIIAAVSNTSYTTRQIRNIFLSTAAPTSAAGEDGDIWFQYE